MGEGEIQSGLKRMTKCIQMEVSMKYEYPYCRSHS